MKFRILINLEIHSVVVITIFIQKNRNISILSEHDELLSFRSQLITNFAQPHCKKFN